MKILHFALITPTSPQLGLRGALRDLAGSAEEYAEFDWIPYWRLERFRELRDDLLQQSRAFNPDLVFMQIQTPNILPGFLLDSLGESATTVSWCGDLRDTTPRWALDAAPHVDLMTFSNLRDVQNIRAEGSKAEFLNIGFSTEVFNPQGPAEIGGIGTGEIVFLGTNYANRFPRSAQRQAMVSLLRSRYGQRFSVHGGGWGERDVFLLEQSEAAAYRACSIAINQNHYDDVPRFTSDRIFRAMGSGAFCLSNDWPGLAEDFSEGEHLDVWRNFDELTAKIDYHLDHPDERKAIADAGCRHVHANHSWAARMGELKAMLNND